MNDDIKEKLDNLRIYAGREENGFICDIEDYITNLQQENEKLLKICSNYDKEIEKLNGVINELKEQMYNFCEECSSNDCCAEDECVLYLLEDILEEKEL